MISLQNFKNIKDCKNLYTHPDCPPISYNDGDISEDYLLEIIKKANDVSTTSLQLRQAIKDWASEYHLSPARYNLLRPFKFNPEQKILELGCGCGAITRYLGEQGLQVEAIEGSARRARITANRCRDLDNVKVFSANYNDVDFPANTYDFISLIGVLEYAPSFYGGQDLTSIQAMQQILKYLLLSLKPDGQFIIAIENKLGLKYLAGCTEDHTNIEYEGIFDYPNSNKKNKNNKIATLSRYELNSLLKSLGVSNVEFYYPFPDYKLPSSILSNDFINTNGASAFIYPSKDYVKERKYHFPEIIVGQSLIKASLLADFSNSFLILASRKDLFPNNFDFVHFTSPNRKNSFQIKTIKPKSEPIVKRSFLFPSSTQTKEGILSQRLCNESYYAGELLSAKLLKAALNQTSLQGFFNLLKQYYQFVNTFCQKEPQNAVDLIFSNTIVQDDGSLVAFDLEWVIENNDFNFNFNKDNLPSFLLFRSIMYWTNLYAPFLPHIKDNFKINTLYDFLIIVFKEVGISKYDEATLRNFSQFEAQIQFHVNQYWDQSTTKMANDLYQSLNDLWPTNDLQTIVDRLNDEKQKQQKYIEGLESSVKELKGYNQNIIKEKDIVINGLKASINELENYSQQIIQDKNSIIQGLESSVSEYKNYNEHLIKNMHIKDCTIQDLSYDTQNLKAILDSVYASKTYKLASLIKKTMLSPKTITKSVLGDQGLDQLKIQISKIKNNTSVSKLKNKDHVRILVLNPYFPTLGGGEKHMGYLCKFFEDYFPNVEIHILVYNVKDLKVHSPNFPQISDLNARFGLSLKKTSLLPFKEISPKEIAGLSKSYDLFINFMFLSKHIGLAGNNIYMCMFPPKPSSFDSKQFNNWLADTNFKASYHKVISNSQFTKNWFQKYWKNKEAKVLYPPVFSEVELPSMYKDSSKENIILSVGRFFVGDHSKKQDLLVDFFLKHQQLFKGWELHLVGALEEVEIHKTYVEKIKSKIAAKADKATKGNKEGDKGDEAKGPAIYLHVNSPYDQLTELYKKAKIFWHATGYKEDSSKNPEKMEHFGITTVEAMSYGLVPIVINKGGQVEIVEPKRSGFLWENEDQCIEYTQRIIENNDLRQQLAKAAHERARLYSIESFNKNCQEIFSNL